MANLVFSYVNHVDLDAAMLSASTQLGDNSPSNMADPIIGRRWRSGITDCHGHVDFGADVAIDVVALRFPRDETFDLAALGGTVRHGFDLSAGAAGTGGAHDSGAIAIGAADGYGYHVYFPPSTVTARYWRFTFQATGVSFIDVGRAWAGPKFQPERNLAWGWGDEWADLSRVSKAERSGAGYVDERANFRRMTLEVPFSENDKAMARELGRVAGIRKQVLFVRDPSAPALETVIGRMSETHPILCQGLRINSRAFILEESL